MAADATLRVLTFDPEPPDNLVVLDATIPCDGSYTCPCAGCKLDRVKLMRRGVRPSQSVRLRAA